MLLTPRTTVKVLLSALHGAAVLYILLRFMDIFFHTIKVFDLLYPPTRTPLFFFIILNKILLLL